MLENLIPCFQSQTEFYGFSLICPVLAGTALSSWVSSVWLKTENQEGKPELFYFLCYLWSSLHLFGQILPYLSQQA